jgi:hypothetical protein
MLLVTDVVRCCVCEQCCRHVALVWVIPLGAEQVVVESRVRTTRSLWGWLQGARVTAAFPAAVIQDAGTHVWTRVTDKALFDGTLRMPARGVRRCRPTLGCEQDGAERSGHGLHSVLGHDAFTSVDVGALQGDVPIRLGGPDTDGQVRRHHSRRRGPCDAKSDAQRSSGSYADWMCSELGVLPLDANGQHKSS